MTGVQTCALPIYSGDSDDEDDLSYEEGELGRRDTEITSGIDQEVGKLIVDEGKSRYITGGFWASLDEDVCRPLRCKSTKG